MKRPIRGLAGLLALALALAARAQVGWSGLAAAAARAPRLELSFDLQHDVQLVHHMILALRGDAADLARVHRVTYHLLPAPLDAASWAEGQPLPEMPGRQDLTVTERGDAPDHGFAWGEPVAWLPTQVVATASYDTGKTLRFGPVQLELPDPALRVGLRPVYATSFVAHPDGLMQVPVLESFHLRFTRHPERPDALADYLRVAVAVGRVGDTHGVYPEFESWSIQALRDEGATLHIGSLDNRRGMPIADVGDRRDFLWVVAERKDGSVESYATWRPPLLPEDMDPAAKAAALAPEELHPFTRTTPLPPPPEEPR